MNRRPLILWSAVLYNLGPVAAGLYEQSYDAHTHLFFADHYLRGWWDLWETRWYGGFTVVSYPPLAHQLLAALGAVMGLDLAYRALLLGLTVALAGAAYLYARLFVSEAASGIAALVVIFLPSVGLLNYTFGQLPTLLALVLGLLACVSGAGFLRHGKLLEGLRTLALIGATTAAHHFTALYGLPFLALAVVGTVAMEREVCGARLVGRLAALLLGGALASLLVIWPFWQWTLHYTAQAPIDHATRHHFLQDRMAQALFFWGEYSVTVAAIPYVFVAAARQARLRPLAGAWLLLFVLGLGGTTPLPRLLFPGMWSWLTYDRFALWSSLLLAVFTGQWWERIFSPSEDRRRAVRVAMVSLAMGFLASSPLPLVLPRALPTQPAPLAMDELLEFLHQDKHWHWRYLTLGFGDQMSKLSRLTVAATIDGNYNTGRTIPALRQSGIEKLDTAKYWKNGRPTLRHFLKHPEPYFLKWVFSNDRFYTPLLKACGWRRLYHLHNNVEIWEKPGVPMLPAEAMPPTSPSGPPFPARGGEAWAAFCWGVAPLASLALALGLWGCGGRAFVRSEAPERSHATPGDPSDL